MANEMNPDAAEALAGHRPRWRGGFRLARSLACAFAAVVVALMANTGVAVAADVSPTATYAVTVSASCKADDNLDKVANDFIGKCRKGSIRREFPSEFLPATLMQIKYGCTKRARTVWKLLNDNRFKK